MRTKALLLSFCLGMVPAVASGAPAPSPEEVRKEAPPSKATPTPAAARKDAPQKAGSERTQQKKTDPRGLEVEPVNFKKAPEKPKPH
jgi:hypothetical protein